MYHVHVTCASCPLSHKKTHITLKLYCNRCMCIIIKQVHTQIISQTLSVYNTLHMANHFARNVNYMSNRKCTNCRADFNSENYECPPSLHSKVHDK